MNPFHKIKDPVLVEMLKEVAKRRRMQPEKMIESLVKDAYKNLKQYCLNAMKRFKSFIDSRPAYNNPKDDDDIGMNDKLKTQCKDRILYGGDISNIKTKDTIDLQR